MLGDVAEVLARPWWDWWVPEGAWALGEDGTDVGGHEGGKAKKVKGSRTFWCHTGELFWACGRSEEGDIDGGMHQREQVQVASKESGSSQLTSWPD